MTGWTSLRVTPEHERVVACQLVAPGSRFPSRYRPGAAVLEGMWYALRRHDHRKRNGDDAVALAVPGALVLRAAIAERVLAPLVEQGQAQLIGVTLASNRDDSELSRPRKLSDDWRLVETGVRFPLDREGLAANAMKPPTSVGPGSVFDPKRPWASLVATFTAAPTWSEPRAPREPLFRLLELPAEIFGDAKLVGRLRRALGKGVIEGAPHDARLQLVDELRRAPAFPQTARASAASASAFFRLAAGEGKRGDRGKALGSPLWAYAVARILEGPKDDSRAAACTHPVTAAAYARDVDGAPREDTREAACVHMGSAIAYMREVDRGPHEVTSRGFADHFKATELEVEARELAERWDGAAAKTKPTDVTDWVGLDTSAGPMASWRDGRPGPHKRPELENTEVGIVIGGAKTAAAVKKKIGKWNALAVSGWLAFRRSAIEPVIADLDANGIRLLPVPVVDAQGAVVDDDWAILELTGEWPLDRDACDATYQDPDKPQGSAPMRLDAVRYGAGRAPAKAAFRIGDLPSIGVFRPDVAERIQAAVGRGVAVCSSLKGLLSFARVSGSSPPLPCSTSEDIESAAGQAFWQLVAGERAEGLREVVCRSPHYAYWLARVVDGRPADDTRAAVLAHPHYAAEYAQLVDRRARDDTRAAAATDHASAMHYAEHVDGALTPPIVAALKAAGWGDADLDTLNLPRRD